MKFLQEIKHLMGRDSSAGQATTSAQSDVNQEAGLKQNAAGIKMAIDGGYAVAADHTRMEVIQAHLDAIQAKRDTQVQPQSIKESTPSPTRIPANGIDKRLSDISKLKKPNKAA